MLACLPKTWRAPCRCCTTAWAPPPTGIRCCHCAQTRLQRKRDAFASLLGDDPLSGRADKKGGGKGKGSGKAKGKRPDNGMGSALRGESDKRPEPGMPKGGDSNDTTSRPQQAESDAKTNGTSGRKRGSVADVERPLKSKKLGRWPTSDAKADVSHKSGKKFKPIGAAVGAQQKPRSRVDRLAAFSAALKM